MAQMLDLILTKYGRAIFARVFLWRGPESRSKMLFLALEEKGKISGM